MRRTPCEAIKEVLEATARGAPPLPAAVRGALEAAVAEHMETLTYLKDR